VIHTYSPRVLLQRAEFEHAYMAGISVVLNLENGGGGRFTFLVDTNSDEIGIRGTCFRLEGKAASKEESELFRLVHAGYR
jgi:hypothetical protein